MAVYEPEAEPQPLVDASGLASAKRQAMSRADPCPCCGRRALRPVTQVGRVCRYRNAALTLPAGLPVPTCRRCKHMLLTFDSVPELAAALEAAYRAELVQRAAVEITRLGKVYSLRHLQEVLDLSHGYLSRLRAGAGVPSAALVSLLALLSAEPTRLEELKRYWALPISNPPGMSERKPRP